jgi:hypothetical protein
VRVRGSAGAGRVRQCRGDRMLRTLDGYHVLGLRAMAPVRNQTAPALAPACWPFFAR